MQVKSEISKRKLFDFYINYSLLNKFTKCYLQEESEMMAILSNALAYSAFNVKFEDEDLAGGGLYNAAGTANIYSATFYGNGVHGETDSYIGESIFFCTHGAAVGITHHFAYNFLY